MNGVWEKWHFSSELGTELKEFAAAFGCHVADHSDDLPNNNTVQIENDENSFKAEEIEVDGMNDVTFNTANESVETHVAIEVASSSVKCTQVISRLGELLHEGPVPYEEISNFSETDIVRQLAEASDTVLLNFCQSICLCSVQKGQELINLFCDRLLLPKLQDPTFAGSRVFIAILHQTIDIFPDKICSTLLLPLMINTNTNCSDLVNVFDNMDISKKQIIIKLFLDNGIHKINEQQIQLFTSLMTPSLNQELNKAVVNILWQSSHDLNRSAQFGKLLALVINKIGTFLDEDSKAKLVDIVTQHKSFQKRIAQKALTDMGVK